MHRFPKFVDLDTFNMCNARCIMCGIDFDRRQGMYMSEELFEKIVRELGVDRIDLLKIDVEKAELDVLSGIEDGDWDKVQQVVIELHDMDDRLNVITTLLQRKGLTEMTVEQPPTLVGSNIFTVFAARPLARRRMA